MIAIAWVKHVLLYQKKLCFFCKITAGTGKNPFIRQWPSKKITQKATVSHRNKKKTPLQRQQCRNLHLYHILPNGIPNLAQMQSIPIEIPRIRRGSSPVHRSRDGGRVLGAKRSEAVYVGVSLRDAAGKGMLPQAPSESVGQFRVLFAGGEVVGEPRFQLWPDENEMMMMIVVVVVAVVAVVAEAIVVKIVEEGTESVQYSIERSSRPDVVFSGTCHEYYDFVGTRRLGPSASRSKFVALLPPTTQLISETGHFGSAHADILDGCRWSCGWCDVFGGNRWIQRWRPSGNVGISHQNDFDRGGAHFPGSLIFAIVGMRALLVGSSGRGSAPRQRRLPHYSLNEVRMHNIVIDRQHSNALGQCIL